MLTENLDPETELTIVDMLRYSLEHADKNLPPTRFFMKKMNKVCSFLHDLRFICNNTCDTFGCMNFINHKSQANNSVPCEIHSFHFMGLKLLLLPLTPTICTLFSVLIMARNMQVLSPPMSSILLAFLVLGIAIILANLLRGHIRHGPGPRAKFRGVWSKHDIEWHKIRHLWLG